MFYMVMLVVKVTIYWLLEDRKLEAQLIWFIPKIVFVELLLDIVNLQMVPIVDLRLEQSLPTLNLS